MNGKKQSVGCQHHESVTIMGVTFCMQCENITYSAGSTQKICDAIENVRRILNSNRGKNYSLLAKYTNERENLSQPEICFVESASIFNCYVSIFGRAEQWPHTDIDFKDILHGDRNHQFRDFLEAMENIIEYAKSDSSV